MKTLILLISIILVQEYAKAAEPVTKSPFKLEVIAGYATHYIEFDGYNDATFEDNLTSDVGLIRLSYHNFGVTALSDSQGDLSFALTYTKSQLKRGAFEASLVLGAYILRNELDSGIFSAEMNDILPDLKLGSRNYSVLPLAGLQLDYELKAGLSASMLITPTFTLWGLKISF